MPTVAECKVPHYYASVPTHFFKVPLCFNLYSQYPVVTLYNYHFLRKLDFSKLFKEFKPRLQHQYFNEKLMQIGSFLYSIKVCFKITKKVSGTCTLIYSLFKLNNSFAYFHTLSLGISVGKVSMFYSLSARGISRVHLY